MKAIKTIALICVIMAVLTACDTRDDKDISVTRYKHYVDVTDHWLISTYNGYILRGYTTQQNEDGSYTIVFDVGKVKQ